MLSLNFPKTYSRLIILGVMMTPLFGIFEVLALISGTLTSQGEALTPVYIKVLKDLVFASIILVGIAEVLVRRRIIFNISYTVFMALAIYSAFISFYFMDFLIVVAGIRWILPVLIFPFIYRHVDIALQNRIANCLILLFILGLLLQITQLFLAVGWWGLNSFGLSKRNPGFYLIPSSMACFSAMTAYYARFYCNNVLLRNYVVFLLVPLSIILTASGSGFIALVLFWSYLLYCRVKQKFVVLACATVLFISLLVFIPFLTEREDIYESMQTRANMLTELVNPKNLLASVNFGSATNTGVLLTATNRDANTKSFVADSTVNSLINNTGIVSLLFFMYFLYNSLRHTKSRINISFFLLLLPFLLTIIIFELFPINLLLMVNVAFFYNQVDYNRMQIYSNRVVNS
jgi:hypothetical protein